jgi:hypothetical protein
MLNIFYHILVKYALNDYLNNQFIKNKNEKNLFIKIKYMNNEEICLDLFNKYHKIIMGFENAAKMRLFEPYHCWIHKDIEKEYVERLCKAVNDIINYLDNNLINIDVIDLRTAYKNNIISDYFNESRKYSQKIVMLRMQLYFKIQALYNQ